MSKAVGSFGGKVQHRPIKPPVKPPVMPPARPPIKPPAKPPIKPPVIVKPPVRQPSPGQEAGNVARPLGEHPNGKGLKGLLKKIF